MDLVGRRVTRAGAELELTGREYELLEYLLRHKNEVVTRDMIALDVWKEATGAMTRIIDVYINALRKKIDRLGTDGPDPDGSGRGICLEGRIVRPLNLSIRWRLTLWYGAVLSAILVGFSGAVYLLMQHHLLALTDAALRGEFTEFGDEVGRAGSLAELPEALRSRFAGVEGHEFELSSPAGEPLFRSRGVAPTGLPRPDVGDAGPVDVVGPRLRNMTLERLGPVHLAGGVVRGPSGPLLLQVAASLAPSTRALRELVIVLLTIGPLALACTLGGGYWLARKALEPIDRMAATAAEITSNRLDRRLEAARHRRRAGRAWPGPSTP